MFSERSFRFDFPPSGSREAGSRGGSFIYTVPLQSLGGCGCPYNDAAGPLYGVEAATRCIKQRLLTDRWRLIFKVAAFSVARHHGSLMAFPNPRRNPYTPPHHL